MQGILTNGDLGVVGRPVGVVRELDVRAPDGLGVKGRGAEEQRGKGEKK
jgi:hypothetical protein